MFRQTANMKTIKLKKPYISIFICVYILSALTHTFVHAAQTIPGVQRLEEGIAAYEHGEYDDAIFKLEMAIYQISVDDKENLWESHFYLGLSYYLTGDNEEAQKEFIAAQGLIKNRLPDSNVHSAKVVKLFKEALKPEHDDEWKDPITGIEFVFVNGGCYEMGDTFGDRLENQKPVHEVCLDDFYLGKYEVTNAGFEKFVSETGYVTIAEKKGTSWGISRRGKADWGKKEGINWMHPLWPSDMINSKMNHPVVQISWDDTQEYIKWLNQKTGEAYRLPTEAEWEYAARSGGKREKYAGFTNEKELYKYANFCDSNCEYSWKTERQNDGYEYTSPVGSYKPNGLDHYDMSGNVWEWCQDIYRKKAYRKHQRNNPIYTKSDPKRVSRGGSWGYGLNFLRASFRSFFSPDETNGVLGFRLARTP